MPAGGRHSRSQGRDPKPPRCKTQSPAGGEGNYFYARVYLDGITDGNGTLKQGRNSINVRLKGEGFWGWFEDFGDFDMGTECFAPNGR